ncbi:hypothetical protein LV779_09920 [Streptomyces thinghirensis]|nr:hypothetical protein [Streptomyces thinghirensis]
MSHARPARRRLAVTVPPSSLAATIGATVVALPAAAAPPVAGRHSRRCRPTRPRVALPGRPQDRGSDRFGLPDLGQHQGRSGLGSGPSDGAVHRSRWTKFCHAGHRLRRPRGRGLAAPAATRCGTAGPGHRPERFSTFLAQPAAGLDFAGAAGQACSIHHGQGGSAPAGPTCSCTPGAAGVSGRTGLRPHARDGPQGLGRLIPAHGLITYTSAAPVVLGSDRPRHRRRHYGDTAAGIESSRQR